MNYMNEKISVIVPVLNEETVLAACLERVRALSLLEPDTQVEIVVADGGSADLTRQVALGLADVVVESGRGRARQMNAGVKASSGGILLFLHSDCLLPDNAFGLIREAVRRPGVSLGAFSLGIDHGAFWARMVEITANLRTRLMRVPYGDQAQFMLRTVFERSGGFRELPMMEDIDLGGRLNQMGQVVLLRQKVLTSPRRWLDKGVVRTIALNIRLGFSFIVLGVSPEELDQKLKKRLAQKQAGGLHMDCAILIMAKRPDPESVKTRLKGVLSDPERVELYERMLNSTVERLSHVPEARTYLCHYPPDSGDHFKSFGLPLIAQEGADLGERMLGCLSSAFKEGFKRAIVVGTDVPDLKETDVLEAVSGLEDADVVFGPSEDGGYYLVGMKEPHGFLFEGISWSTPETLRQSIDRVREAGLRYAITRTLHDIDTPEDLKREGLL